METVKISPEERDTLEALHYQAQAALDIAGQAIRLGFLPGSAEYDALALRYADATQAYDAAKRTIIQAVYGPKGQWSVDFRACTLTAEGF